MAIRLDLVDPKDLEYVEQSGVSELIQDVLEEVISQKPEKAELVDALQGALSKLSPVPSPPKPEAFLSRVGNTPLIEVPSPNPKVKIFAKAEFMNPTASIKDRIAEHILNKAEKEGKLKKGDTVVAASSGNTGSAIAMACSTRGYKCKIFTNKKCSEEKINAVKAYGGEIIVGPSGVSADSPDHYQNMAIAAAQECGAFDVNQYDNLANPEAYYLSMGPEIWQQTNGTVTHFVAAGSTGGTISGTGKYLKEQSKDVKVILADPHGSCFTDYYLTGKHSGASSFLVEGVGKDSIPGAMDFAVVDSAIQISDAQAIHTCHVLSKQLGMLVGGSSGLNVAAAQEVAKSLTEPAVIVTVCPDHGLKYLSKYYNAEWLEKMGVKVDDANWMDGKRYQDPVFHGPDEKFPGLDAETQH